MSNIVALVQARIKPSWLRFRSSKVDLDPSLVELEWANIQSNWNGSKLISFEVDLHLVKLG